MKNQKVIVSVTNDLATDQRVDKICNSLTDLNYNVLLIGRYHKDSKFVYRNYETKRFQLWFNKGFLFYANYNIRLFVFLLYYKPDILWSNDLDSLPCNFLYAKLKSVKLIFDSHEYFTEVPELLNKPFTKLFWKKIEQFILPKLKQVITVSQSIADLYVKEYKIKVQLLRNVPRLNKQKNKVENLKVLDKKILLYQGALNINRGIEQMVKSMLYLEDCILYIIGDGDIADEIKELITANNLADKVRLLGRIPLEKLHDYTIQADIGLSLEEDKGLNYRFSLPNKLFDYIQAGIPVLTSGLPEMKKLVIEYQVGETIENHDPKHIAKKINSMFTDDHQLKTWSENTKKASIELNWERETSFIQDFLKDAK